MVKLTKAKQDRIFIYSDCCKQVMTCDNSDRMNPDWYPFIGRSVQIKGKCPYCKLYFTDFWDTKFFTAKVLSIMSRNINPEMEETKHGRNSN